MNLRLALAAALACGAAACSSKPPVESYAQLIAQWVNRPEASLVSAWGLPTRSQKLADGGQADQYDIVNASGDVTCTTIFSVAAGGAIQNASSTGTECRAPKLGGAR